MSNKNESSWGHVAEWTREYLLLNIKSIPPADHNRQNSVGLFLETNVQNFTLKYLKFEYNRAASDRYYYLQY